MRTCWSSSAASTRPTQLPRTRTLRISWPRPTSTGSRMRSRSPRSRRRRTSRKLSEPSGFTRRTALAALCAMGLQLALSGRARAETPAAAPPVHTEWNSLRPEEQKILSRYGEKWNTLPPEQQQRPLVGAPRWQAKTRQRWHRFRELTPEQQQRVREGYRGYRKLTPEQRQRMRERWQNATPEQRQKWLEKRRERQGKRHPPTPAAP